MLFSLLKSLFDDLKIMMDATSSRF